MDGSEPAVEVTVRTAAGADEGAVRALWEAFEAEVPEPVGEPESWEEESEHLRPALAAGLVLLAYRKDRAVGAGWASPPERGVGHIELVYVRPEARRRGVARALTVALARRLMRAGAETVTLDVVSSNRPAVEAWRRLGFVEIERKLAAPADRVSGDGPP
jgi:ribosomal protein S18 acetylase RimI-like enzyme